MKRLCDELGIDKNIEKVVSDNIEDAVLKVFDSDDYKFYLNSELIDVKNRFRIFNFNGTDFICKKSSIKTAEKELSLVTKAKELVDGIAIDNYTINVVMPNFLKINGDCYIVTEFKGISLQELSYCSNCSALFDIDMLFKILNKFLQLGILYRGFLPRNTILNDNNIYLLDWEDTVFFEKDSNVKVNILWLTNFLLNWCYLYDIDTLRNKLENSDITFGEEPELLKYEIRFAEWTNLPLDKKSLRLKIIDTVLFAEKNLSNVDDNNKYIILPNGLAHLVSDLFDVDIDVLFDISSFVIRNNSEDKYYEIIRLFSSLIVTECFQNKDIHRCSLILILMILEIAASDNYNDIEIPEYFPSEDSFINDKAVLSFKLVYEYINGNSFETMLETILAKVIKNYNNSKLDIENVKQLSNYILSFKEKK